MQTIRKIILVVWWGLLATFGMTLHTDRLSFDDQLPPKCARVLCPESDNMSVKICNTSVDALGNEIILNQMDNFHFKLINKTGVFLVKGVVPVF